MMVFGGHRLWHGFATDNSESNSWSSFDEYPRGGYLEDLWVYTKKQLGEDEQVVYGVCGTFLFFFARNFGRGLHMVRAGKFDIANDSGEASFQFSRTP